MCRSRAARRRRGGSVRCRRWARCPRCPARMTRDGLPWWVRASTVLPSRTISNPVVCSRSAASTSSAMRCSSRDSLGMSTSAAVSAIGSPRKSRPTPVEASRVASTSVTADARSKLATAASGVGVATIAADGTIRHLVPASPSWQATAHRARCGCRWPRCRPSWRSWQAATRTVTSTSSWCAR